MRSIYQGGRRAAPGEKRKWEVCENFSGCRDLKWDRDVGKWRTPTLTRTLTLNDKLSKLVIKGNIYMTYLCVDNG